MLALDSSTVLVALIAGLLGPGVLVILNGNQQRKIKIEDWARQDAVADKAEAVAQRLVEVNMETARITAEAAISSRVERGRIAEQLRKVSETVDTVHILTNSALTEAKKAQLLALEQVQALLAVVVRTGIGAEAVDAHERTESNNKRIAELTQEIRDRESQQMVIDAKISNERRADHDTESTHFKINANTEAIADLIKMQHPTPMAGIPLTGEGIAVTGKDLEVHPLKTDKGDKGDKG